MNESVHQQIIPLIERSERILLCTHRKPDGDAVGSIMALSKALNLLGKEVTAACADEIPDMFHFLPDINTLNQSVAAGKDFVVTLDCDKTEVDRLKYHLEDNKIHIVITPKNGQFVKENITCHEGGGNYDLIITVDVADIPQLGKLYTDNSELFASVPVVNIDHHVSNTGFGKINHIDVAASSTAEMLYSLIRDMEKHFSKTLITADIATFLLSGVTTDTGSFQNANTTPRSMEVAADLMEAGANQHDVIKYLFRTKKLSTLKLWGKILTKIEVDTKHRLVWSSITSQDLLQSGAHMEEAGDIIDDLLVHAPEAEMIALFKEDQDTISVSFRSTTPQANVMEIARNFGGGGHVQAAGVKFTGKTLPEVMNQVIALMQSIQQSRLGLDGIQEAPENGASTAPITQVLDGFTPAPPSIQPTLEERVQQSQKPLASSGEVPAAPAEAPQEAKGASHEQRGGKNEQFPVSHFQSNLKEQGPRANGITGNNGQGLKAHGNIEQAPPKAPQNAPQASTGDMHHQTKAAIHAEQSQSSDQALQTPSQGAAMQRPEKAQVEPRFTEPLPEYMKGSNDQSVSMNNDQSRANGDSDQGGGENPNLNIENRNKAQVSNSNDQKGTEQPQAASVQPPAEDGVSVSYGNSSTAAPVIPEDSSEPVVKKIQPMAGSSKDQGPRAKENNEPQASSPQPPATPPATPPKDPFATGDDGLTDIERALGGL